ncbi:hypothetical protein B7P43_G07150 [Cryptotermes secundus]|uniref:Uncharacterized protein n=1 Tax=Cryptotermes secundus TaxID=105785 RepID=A0A2J7Q2B3_9NEOP|nr:hypothetical protein B7P43_G07150 [Cryptotermes secundus]
MDLCQSAVHPLDGVLNLAPNVTGALLPNELKLPAATQLLANLAVQANPADPIQIKIMGTYMILKEVLMRTSFQMLQSVC